MPAKAAPLPERASRPAKAAQAAPGTRPQGARAVREALIRAATELFARRGPGAVSVREIALHAGVNHGLVHRHFGSKDALLSAVLTRLTEQLAVQARVAGGGRLRPVSPQAFRATRRQGAYWRILAHALLEGTDPGDVQQGFPMMSRFVEVVGRRKAAGQIDPALDERALVASAVALALGWLMFEPFLLAATGLKNEAPRRRYRNLTLVWRRFEQMMAPPR